MENSMNLEFARQQMLKQQVRAGEVLDLKILDALASVNREDFVPAEYAGVAFADCTIPLAHGQCMMSPLVERMALTICAPNHAAGSAKRNATNFGSSFIVVPFC